MSKSRSDEKKKDSPEVLRYYFMFTFNIILCWIKVGGEAEAEVR